MKIEVKKPSGDVNLFEKIRNDKLESTIHDIPVKQISSGKYQPRSQFDLQKIQSLADSIREEELLQPIVVEKINESSYKIIAGERRWRAVKLLGHKTIACIIKNRPNEKKAFLSLVENIQREGLNPIEEAIAYKRLQTDFGLTHEKISQKVGKSRSAISNMLRLLELDEQVQNGLRVGSIEMGHGRALISLSPKLQREIFQKIIREKSSVRDTELLVRKVQYPTTRDEKVNVNHELQDFYVGESSLLSGNVNNFKLVFDNKKPEKGRLIINFDSVDELESILNALKKIHKS